MAQSLGGAGTKLEVDDSIIYHSNAISAKHHVQLYINGGVFTVFLGDSSRVSKLWLNNMSIFNEQIVFSSTGCVALLNINYNLKNSKKIYSRISYVFYDTGELECVASRNKHGKLNGKAIHYYKDGSIKYILTYQNGIMKRRVNSTSRIRRF